MSVEHEFSRAKDEEYPKHPGNLELTITITGALRGAREPAATLPTTEPKAKD